MNKPKFGYSDEQKERMKNPTRKPYFTEVPDLSKYTCEGCIYNSPIIDNYSPCRSCVGGKYGYYYTV